MRRHLAIFRLFLAHTGGKVLLVLVLLAAAEGAVVFRWRALAPSASLLGYYERCATGLGILFLAAAVLVSALLLWAGVGWGKGRPGDTLDRLITMLPELVDKVADSLKKRKAKSEAETAGQETE